MAPRASSSERETSFEMVFAMTDGSLPWVLRRRIFFTPAFRTVFTCSSEKSASFEM